jgi:hypothetical protein
MTLHDIVDWRPLDHVAYHIRPPSAPWFARP